MGNGLHRWLVDVVVQELVSLYVCMESAYCTSSVVKVRTSTSTDFWAPGSF